MVENLDCDECFMRDICVAAKEGELSTFRDKDIIRPRLEEYCPLKEIVRSNISKHLHRLATIVDEHQMYFGKENIK